MAHLQVSRIIEAPRSKVFGILTSPEALPDLLKGDIYVEVLNSVDRMGPGREIRVGMTRFGVRKLVHLRVDDYLHSKRMMYHQVEGFFKSWTHIMKFDDHGDGFTLVTDLVDYVLPFGLIGNLTDDLFVKSDMERILENRLGRVDLLL
jgi:ligand-binding SRPBCC domain-containing protein